MRFHLHVRKRVIKLLKSFYASQMRTVVDIATQLVLRMLDEDETVKDLAIKPIEDLWSPPSLAVSLRFESKDKDDSFSK